MKRRFIYIIASTLLLSTIIPSVAAATYRVSGIVEFSYRNYETKIGSSKTSSSTFYQYYGANLSSFLWDPRFIRFGAGINYSRTDTDSHFGSDTLGYNVNLEFFPQMKLSGTAFINQATTNYPSSTNIQGYDITTNAFGGSVVYRPYSGQGNGRNANANNNNNTADFEWGRPKRRYLPDTVSVSFIETDAKSSNMASNPLDESRSDARAQLSYSRSPSFFLDINDHLEEYENRFRNSSYKANTFLLNSTMRNAQGVEGYFGARTIDRTMQNMGGYGTKALEQYYNARLNFAEKNRWSHYYDAQYMETENFTGQFSSQSANANVRYRLLNTVTLRGTLGGYVYDSDVYSTPTMTGQSATTKAVTGGGVLDYNELFRPDFLGPFSFSTGLSSMQGYKDVTSDTGLGNGGGYYYSNSLLLGMDSPGWTRDRMAIAYRFFTLRDHSAAKANSHSEQWSLDLNSSRVPRTTLLANATYVVAESSATRYAVNSVAQTADMTDQRRSLVFQAVAGYQASPNLNLNIGATRGQAKSQQYTLSTFTGYNQTNSVDVIRYGEAAYNVVITRSMSFFASAREETRYTSTNTASISTATRVESLYLTSSIKYQIRQIFISLDYNWRQSIPDTGYRTTQQIYYLSLKRPF